MKPYAVPTFVSKWIPHNPIEAVQQALLLLLQSSPLVTSLVKLSNFVHYTGDSTGPDRPSVSASDLPEIRLAQFGTQGSPFATNTGSTLSQSFIIEYHSGDVRVRKFHNAIKMAIFRAIVKSKGDLGLPYDVTIRLGSIDEGLAGSRTEIGRGVAGWVGLVNITVDLSLKRKEI